MHHTPDRNSLSPDVLACRSPLLECQSQVFQGNELPPVEGAESDGWSTLGRRKLESKFLHPISPQALTEVGVCASDWASAHLRYKEAVTTAISPSLPGTAMRSTQLTPAQREIQPAAVPIALRHQHVLACGLGAFLIYRIKPMCANSLQFWEEARRCESSWHLFARLSRRSVILRSRPHRPGKALRPE